MSELPQGGSFLFTPGNPQTIFTPEDFTDEHRMIAETVSQFLEEKILPRTEEIEVQKPGLMQELLLEAAEIGLLGADIPAEFGGIETDEMCSVIIAEVTGKTGSFGTSQGVDTSIGSLPIIYFGNEYQKEKYLPKIASGEKISAYALTEPDAGSDAVSIKTKAVLSEDGTHYLLNGGKTFISNAGIASLFIVYAKIDGDKFTAFIVDADSDGLTLGDEEKKMGIKGSSTRSIYFDNVKVPVENLLHKPGRGHVVAFNTLNIGRHKVSAQALGAAKYALNLSAEYANERKQFKTPIAKFGLIKEKLAEMAIRIFASESIIYRTGGFLMDAIRHHRAKEDNNAETIAKGIQEYAVECSLEKVFVTEMEAFVVDQGVQVHGGYGFIAEYPIERLYRDARVKRIFEGTSEINRILVPTTLLRRDASGDLPLLSAARELKKSVENEIPNRKNPGEIVQGIKDTFIFLLGVTHERYGDKLAVQQELLARLADIGMQAYGADSCWLRMRKCGENGSSNSEHKSKMATAFIYKAAQQTALSAGEIIESVATESDLPELQAALAKLLNYVPIDNIALRREIAETISGAGKYIS